MMYEVRDCYIVDEAGNVIAAFTEKATPEQIVILARSKQLNDTAKAMVRSIDDGKLRAKSFYNKFKNLIV